MIPALTAYALTVAFTIVSAIVDTEHLKDKDYIESHTSRWVLRLLFFIAMGAWNPIYILASALIFTATFDQILNKFMDNSIWYLGDTALWDKFWKKRKVLYIIMKVSAFVLGTYLFIP